MMRLAVILIVIRTAIAGAEPATQPAPLVKWEQALRQSGRWYAGPDAIRIAENVLLWQQDCGGWNKNIEMAETLSAQRKTILAGEKSRDVATIDNDATTTQIRYLARVFNATGDRRYRAGAEAGIAYLFKAQYPDSGGWPQYFPLRGGYHDCITYNDNAMLNVMLLLNDISRRQPDFAFLPGATRDQATIWLDQAIECLLKTQIIVNGRRTAWCAQHDPKTLAPAKGRSYELPSISGSESVGLVKFLMRIEHPSPRVIEAVEDAVAWFEQVKITGKRLEETADDRLLLDDPNGRPLWARFYEIGTNRPIYSRRDGIVQYEYTAVEKHRRTGYAWIRPWATDLLAKDYPVWKARVAKH